MTIFVYMCNIFSIHRSNMRYCYQCLSRTEAYACAVHGYYLALGVVLGVMLGVMLGVVFGVVLGIMLCVVLGVVLALLLCIVLLACLRCAPKP